MFKYLALSDVHLGHPRNSTSNIIKNLDTFFNYFSKYTDLDALFIAGDLFDTLIDNHTSDYHEIVIWIHRLMDFCTRNSIRLRVLEGTPSHDWGQSKIFDTLAEISDTSLDIKYINSIYVEFLEDKGIYILYVPDEAMENAEATYNYILKLMKDLSISKVDIAIMHGMFGYQMNNVITNQTHNEQAYLDIVRFYIHIGHIHSHSVYKRIIAQGSFDRLAHGEEEDKGAILATIEPFTHNTSYEFIVNKDSKVFKTISIPKAYTLDEALEKLDKHINKLPINSYVRIKANKNHVVYQAFKELEKRYLDYYLSKKNEEDLVSDSKLLDDITETNISYEVITILPSNISDLIVANADLTNLELSKLISTIDTVATQI